MVFDERDQEAIYNKVKAGATHGKQGLGFSAKPAYESSSDRKRSRSRSPRRRDRSPAGHSERDRKRHRSRSNDYPNSSRKRSTERRSGRDSSSEDRHRSRYNRDKPRNEDLSLAASSVRDKLSRGSQPKKRAGIAGKIEFKRERPSRTQQQQGWEREDLNPFGALDNDDRGPVLQPVGMSAPSQHILDAINSTAVHSFVESGVSLERSSVEIADDAHAYAIFGTASTTKRTPQGSLPSETLETEVPQHTPPRKKSRNKTKPKDEAQPEHNPFEVQSLMSMPKLGGAVVTMDIVNPQLLSSTKARARGRQKETQAQDE